LAAAVLSTVAVRLLERGVALAADEPELGGPSTAESDHDPQLERAMRRLLALERAECASRYSVIDGRRLHYLEAGSGPPLLLLHGASGGAANWYRLIGPLARRWRVLAPDLPGFGFSDPIEPVGLLGRQVAELIARWLSTLGIDLVDVVGTSFGGIVALRLPDAFAVHRIVAIDSVGLSRRLPLLLRVGTLPPLVHLAVRPTRRGTRLLLRRVFTHMRLEPEHEAALIDYLFFSAIRGDVRIMARAFVRFAGLAGQRDVLSTEQLSRLADRLLLVWGERDEFLPLYEAQRARALAGCQPVRIIPGAGHSPNWEQPQLLFNVITGHLTNE
jgi:pimeloyl-ACP methyl ester carboxylesterase